MILPNTDSLSSASIDHAPCDQPSRASALDPARAELAALVHRAQADDAAAQAELVHRYTRRMHGFVRGIVRQHAAVEDLVQTVFIKMFRRLARLRDPGSFESWLFMLARNTSLDFLRRQRRRPLAVSCDEELFQIPDTRGADGTGEILDALERALARLHPQTRTLVTLYVQGCSYDTLAARAGLTLGAVKARLHRARPLLRASVGAATGLRLPD